jgi:hypothetical protein
MMCLVPILAERTNLQTLTISFSRLVKDRRNLLSGPRYHLMDEGITNEEFEGAKILLSSLASIKTLRKVTNDFPRLKAMLMNWNFD